MVNVVAADTGIAVMYAKYHYLFWRPVTAIDPTAVSPTASARCRATTTATPRRSSRRAGGRCSSTPNHPEYPAAHGSLTCAMADVFSAFLGSNQINLDIHGFDPNGPAGNLNAVQHFNTADDLRTEIVNARVWGRRPLPLLRPRRGHPRLEGRRVRPRTRLPTNRLIPAPAASARAR